MNLAEEQAAINRRQRIAEALMQQGQEPLETNQMAGGYVVPVSPLAGVAKVAQQLAGAYTGRKADERQAALSDYKMKQLESIDFNSPESTNQLAKAGFIEEAIKMRMKKAENENRYQPTNQVVMGDDGKLHLRRYGSGAGAPVIDDPATIPNSLRWIDNGSEYVPVETKGYPGETVNQAPAPVQIPPAPTGEEVGGITISEDASEYDRKILEMMANANGVAPKYVKKKLTPAQEMQYDPEVAGALEEAKQNAKAGAEKEAVEQKPLPVQALKMQQDNVDLISTSAGIAADLNSLVNQIDAKKLDFGLVDNAKNEVRNFFGDSTEQSRNYNSAVRTLEKMRNQSLLLNKGVQTEGDAERAWNELFKNLNDTKAVKQRLLEISATNERAINIRKNMIKNIRQEYGKGDIDLSPYENQPATVGNGVGGWKVEEVK